METPSTAIVGRSCYDIEFLQGANTVVSEYPAGLSRQILEEVMRLDGDVLSYSRVEGPSAMWQAAVSVEGGEPVNVIVDNGINEIYVQALIRLDYDEITSNERELLIAAALTALEPYATVGMTQFGGNIFLRSAFFIDHSTIHAFTNTLKAIVMAYSAYNRQIPITAEAMRA
ncbi:hypothetical protein [Mycobacteroides abscessus]|uniref:hypothetical protein n=1 Tax=Mycobacteroides abscessus TaxID=36809 RepID=UPI001056D303|nr:hypothetical protein [Mycobacteroides abscessus]